VRPRGEARPFQETLRHAIAAAVHDANVVNVLSMQDRVDPQIRPWRLGATMFGLFGAVALLVAAIGLYTAIAYSTEQRKHEFGIRLAIGLGTGRLVRGVMLEGVRTATAGVVIGALVALLAGGRIAPLLFNVSARDPVVFAIVVALLLSVAALASTIPAWQAGNTDPVTALRSP
jgi:ABC-type antimicrobial peptide transport system permease subunit